eukprot:CAMPEP_0196795088 /NCGR_PEP_ID=MMETSP1104-20130614/35425_1 /TAXON_ID=33652 /ORGANISM="Cafeteria sp., Strain Caron Lab Isolate" /LENGTH=68 /DNA_ID=CAMNT_0042165477 /DNA_START=37 /DNA_END=243 /DNA_ORIENTATION=-
MSDAIGPRVFEVALHLTLLHTRALPVSVAVPTRQHVQDGVAQRGRTGPDQRHHHQQRRPKEHDREGGE